MTMRHSLAVASLASALLLVLSTTPARARPGSLAGATPGTSRGDTGLRELLQDAVVAGVPGIVVRVEGKHDIRAVSAGVNDLDTGAELRPGARFRVGSITKTFVATVVLQLVGEGRLHLDEPVEHLLPGLLAGGSVTVRQLLNHTSGLFDYTADPAVLAGIVANRTFEPRQLVGIAERHPRLFAPGTAWSYSNTDYVVAGLLVQAVTHHQLGRELRQRILEPLHLRQTSFPATTARIGGYHAHGYVPADLVPTPDGRPLDVTTLNPSAAWAAGAIISNAADLSRFYRALMTGRLLTPRLLRAMKSTVAEDPAHPNRIRYGLGIERVQDPCGANWGHTGAIFGYQALAYWNDQSGRTVVMASTMFPAPAAEAALSKVTDVALCGSLDERVR